ncbi:restriction endonuclease subunit S [Gallibacterium anatis]|uniref:restriction endonuclease subunit S n=1 Tax=Gallibacterium anatis TaxID=750 RepID=UPI003006C85C
MSNIPKLRFPEFTDAWEKCKLGKIAIKVTEKNKDGIFQETLTNSAEFGVISQRDFFDKDISNPENLNGYYIVKPNDFVYNPRISNLAPVGPIKRNQLNRIGIMSPLYFIFRVSSNIDLDFLDSFFSTNLWHLFMKLNGDSGARADRIAIKDKIFMEMPISFPTLSEQQKIGNLFKQLDRLITLHKRKWDDVILLKKALLQKMFPKNGSDFPEIRFSEFTDAWEKCKLENFVEITTGKLDANAMVNDGKYDFYTSGIKKFKINIPAFTGPAITIAGNGATVGFMHLADGEFNAYQRTYVLTKFSNSIREFLFYEIGIKLPRKISAEARTGNIPYIVMDMLTNLDVFTPTVPEQQKIGNLFKQLDHLITLHKRQHEHYQLLKKALLQQMFV